MNFNSAENKFEFIINGNKEYFTKTEHDIFKYLLIGATAKDIAKKINRSHRTIEDYINKIKIKLQCSNKSHIPEAALRLGLMQQLLASESLLK